MAGCRTIDVAGWAYAVAVIAIVTLGKEVCQIGNHEELAMYVRHTYGVIIAVARHDC